MRVYYATDSNNVESVSDMNKTNFVHPRDQIVDIMQRIYGYGMTTTSGGNLSILDSDGNMWISPASVDKGTLRREDIVCVKPDGTSKAAQAVERISVPPRHLQDAAGHQGNPARPSARAGLVQRGRQDSGHQRASRRQNDLRHRRLRAV